MFKNYLKVAFRNITHHKGYSFISIFGLAIGISCCLFIFQYVHHELTYDTHHKEHDRIFRVAENIRKKTGDRIFAIIAFPVVPTLKETFPQVEEAGRFFPIGSGIVKNQKNNKVFYESKRFAVEQELLNIFTFNFIKGNPSNALARPNTVVITEGIAGKYFGKTEPLGQMLKIDKYECEVTGVVANLPSNTHWKYDILLSMKTYGDSPELTNWYGTSAYSYIKIAPNVDAAVFEKKMSNIADKYISERTKSRGISYVFSMQPLADIHLHSDLRYEVENPGNYQMIFIFASIGLLVLLIACINFINLATARSVNRAREVGVRKVVGGQRKQLILQFLSESFMVVILSIFAAILLIGNIIPLFNSLVGTHFNFADFFQPHMVMIMLALLLFAGFVAGVYPAFFLSAFKPASVLKASRGSGSAKSPLRRALVLFQFSISIILIILTINVFKQLDYMKHKHLGFDKEQKLVVQFRGGMSIDKNYESVKEKFLKHSGILNASVSTGLPGGWMNNFSVMLVGEENDMNQGMYHVYYDPDFVPNFNIKMLAGRAFDKEMGTDEGKTCLINRAATKALGFSTPGEALGKIIKSGHGSKELRVIGVTGDYHFRGLQHKIEPLLMAWRPNRFDNMTLTLKGDDPAKTLAFVKNTWAALYPGYPFNYYFLDENFNKQYNAEEQSSQLFSIFAILGQMIACLGLLGLAAFTTRQRTKEIGIRKVLGASVSNITFLISKEFLKWVLWANVIAWPLGYLVINQWLGGFAYRTGIGFQSFLFASLLTLFIAILTVSYKSLRAAISNPVKSLRFE